EVQDHRFAAHAGDSEPSVHSGYLGRRAAAELELDFHKDGSVTYGSVNDLHNYHENDRVQKDSTTEPVSKQWMRSKHRRSYPN
ncbi:hypothetical protein ACC685_38005, partial [Rhizobium ruizarguesonis]